MLLLPRLTLLAALLAHSLWEETGGEAAEAATEPPKPLAKMVRFAPPRCRASGPQLPPPPPPAGQIC